MAPTAQPIKKLAHFTEADKLLKECAAIDTELEAVSHLYEQYFVGVERVPPLKKHARLRSRFENLKSTFNRTTAFQFRVQSLGSRILAFERLWRRTLQEMEDGTYRRDVYKARLRSKVRSTQPQERALNDAPKEQPASPARDAADQSPKKEAPTSPGAAVFSTELSDAKLRIVYDAYLSAKKRCSEDVSQLSFESVAAKLRKQVPQLMDKHKVGSVEFKILIKDGKAVLKAIPKA
jgi:hypothetical protein